MVVHAISKQELLTGLEARHKVLGQAAQAERLEQDLVVLREADGESVDEMRALAERAYRRYRWLPDHGEGLTMGCGLVGTSSFLVAAFAPLPTPVRVGLGVTCGVVTLAGYTIAILANRRDLSRGPGKDVLDALQRCEQVTRDIEHLKGLAGSPRAGEIVLEEEVVRVGDVRVPVG